MKGKDSLQKSYLSQKKIFDDCRNKKLANINAEIQKCDEKAKKLIAHASALKEARTSRETEEFESFESFRLKAEQASQAAKSKS